MLGIWPPSLPLACGCTSTSASYRMFVGRLHFRTTSMLRCPRTRGIDRKLELMQMAADLCRLPAASHQSPAPRHAWIASERRRLGIDEAVGEWSNKPLLYHLKARPHRFLRAMATMSEEREVAGGRAFALYPLRHTYVPRHVRFDQKALRDLLRIGKSDYIKEKAKKRQKRSEVPVEDDLDLPPLQPNGAGYENDAEAGPSAAPSPSAERKRRTKDEMEDENKELFESILDLRAAGVARRQRFDFAFTTDGVCARLQMRSKTSSGDGGELTSMPSRGIWAIDQLKHVSRLEELHVVGVDPGKRELIVGGGHGQPQGLASGAVHSEAATPRPAQPPVCG